MKFKDYDDYEYDDRKEKEKNKNHRRMKRMKNALRSKDIDSLYDDEDENW